MARDDQSGIQSGSATALLWDVEHIFARMRARPVTDRWNKPFIAPHTGSMFRAASPMRRLPGRGAADTGNISERELGRHWHRIFSQPSSSVCGAGPGLDEIGSKRIFLSAAGYLIERPSGGRAAACGCDFLPPVLLT